MKTSRPGQFGLGLVLFAALALPLSGCSSSGIGASAFGSNSVAIAELEAGAATTPQVALVKARGHFRNSDFGHSAAYYKKAVELAPENAEGYFGLAASYDRLGRFDLSDRAYAALAKLSTPSVQYHNNLGYSYMLRGDLKRALASFRHAERLDPDNIVVANNLQLLADAANSTGA
ncbi:MAG: tetratricopeptide repeat protein [Alphaproteobacteria bacterium]|nr:tetratricopeptide repeat protein [Alphaproteobacteria bacterium]